MFWASDIGSRIRYFRKLKGWSQETLALQAEINPAFLGHLERGLKSPTVKTLEKIACALDISMAELFAEPKPVSGEKDAILTELHDLLQGLSVNNLNKIAIILQNILSLE